MPVPALLGIPALMTFLGTALGSLISWFITRLSKRVIVFGLAMAAVLSALTAIYSQFTGYISQLSLTMPSEMQTASMFFPSNTMTCIGIIASAEVTALIYRFAMYIIKTKMDLVS